MGLADFKLAVGWIQKLGGVVKKKRIQRSEEVKKLGDDLMVKPLDLVPFFVEPDCQPYNPADHHEIDHIDSQFRSPAFNFITEFIRTPVPRPEGGSHLFVLADAGMGKTSLLAMFKMAHIHGFWPKKTECLVYKISPSTLDELAVLKEKSQTVLLLDALDEDPAAMIDIEDRVGKILHATRVFARVIITCRTQFFPRGESDLFKRQDRIKLGPFDCRVVYVSLFNDAQVLLYLQKRYPADPFTRLFRMNHYKVDLAEGVLATMGSLKFRPMLLSYIDDFVKAGVSLHGNVSEVFSVLVHAWLDRELLKGFSFNKHKVWKACEALAFYMFRNGVRAVSPETLAELESASLLGELPREVLQGRALLNRNSSGDFRFAHYSIQEFFFVEHGDLSAMRPTDLMVQFIRSKRRLINFEGTDFSGRDLTGVDFSDLDLSGADLSGSTLTGADLRKLRMEGGKAEKADFSYAKFQGAAFRKVSFAGCTFSGAELAGVKLAYCQFPKMKFENGDFSETDLEGSDFSEAKLSKARFRNAWLKKTCFQRADLSGADFRRAKLENASLVEANLSESLFGSTDKEEVAILFDANLQGAILENTNLINIILTDVSRRDADLSHAKTEQPPPERFGI